MSRRTRAWKIANDPNQDCKNKYIAEKFYGKVQQCPHCNSWIAAWFAKCNFCFNWVKS